MVITDLTNLTNISQVSDIVVFINRASDGIFLGMFTVTLFLIITLILMRRGSVLNAIYAASAITTLLSFILMTAFNLLWIYFIIYLMITVILTYIRYTEVG
jgi:membrane protease YdiL (CAAX protease family)